MSAATRRAGEVAPQVAPRRLGRTSCAGGAGSRPRSCHIWRATSGIVGVTTGRDPPRRRPSTPRRPRSPPRPRRRGGAVVRSRLTVGGRAEEQRRRARRTGVELGAAQHVGRPRAGKVDRRRASRTRPGRGVITATRSARNTASAIEWVTSRVVVARSRPDPLQLDVEALAGHLVEGAERLVEQQHVGIGDERPGDRHALAHPARELRRAGLLEAAQADEVDQAGDAAAGSPTRR